jgi:hypothetical protein
MICATQRKDDKCFFTSRSVNCLDYTKSVIDTKHEYQYSWNDTERWRRSIQKIKTLPQWHFDQTRHVDQPGIKHEPARWNAR